MDEQLKSLKTRFEWILQHFPNVVENYTYLQFYNQWFVFFNIISSHPADKDYNHHFWRALRLKGFPKSDTFYPGYSYEFL